MIVHVDMDAFYASIEERDQPDLAGRPLIVGGTPQGRGVVAAANYVVRKFGVHSAMPTATALRLCPKAIVLPPRMDYYSRISEQIRNIFFRFTPLVEPLSLDEAFLDVSGSEALFGPAPQIGRRIKEEICREVGLVASVGIAPSKFVAKVASDLEKPDGFVVVVPDEVQQFLDPLPVSRLWGVGRVTGQTLDKLGLRPICDVRLASVELLQRHFGEHGIHLWRLAHGQDDRRVVPDREAKSISHETTFAQDIDDLAALRAWVVELAEQVASRLRRIGLYGRTVHLKVRYADFHTVTRGHTLPTPTNVTSKIAQAAVDLLCHRLPNRHLSVRLVGVGVSGFAGHAEEQRFLFDEGEPEVQSELDRATDEIRNRYGKDAVSRASRLLYRANFETSPRPGPGET